MTDDLLTTIRAELRSRMGQLESAVEEYEDLLAVLDALDTTAGEDGASSAHAADGALAAADASNTSTVAPTIDAAAQAILAALEHGSHTLAELGVVTALPAGQIRESVRGLRSSGKIVTAEREGPTAYALPADAE